MSNEAYVDSSGLVAPNEVSGAMRASLIENNGIDVIAESERTAKPSISSGRGLLRMCLFLGFRMRRLCMGSGSRLFRALLLRLLA